MSCRPEDAVEHGSQDIGSGAISVAAVVSVLISALEPLLEIVPIVRLADMIFPAHVA